MQDLSHQTEDARRKAVVAAGQTDRQRWEHAGSYEAFWSARAGAAARLCGAGQWVCDIGCGMQSLRAALPAGCVYLPADLRAWTPDVERCDLNEGVLPGISLGCCDVVVMLGVLEYIYDVRVCLASIAKRAERLVLSYNCVELAAYDRAGFGWVNALTVDGLTANLREAGFIPDQVERFGPSEIVIRARAAGFGAGLRARRLLYRGARTAGILSIPRKNRTAA